MIRLPCRKRCLTPDEYIYYIRSTWLQYATTDGWGALQPEGRNSNSTGDNVSGYGINGVKSGGGAGKLLKRVYIYNGVMYMNSGVLVVGGDGKLYPVGEVDGVEKRFVYV